MAEKAPYSPQDDTRPCVLFVDDDESLLTLVRMCSKQRGTFVIETAPTADEAVERINHHQCCYSAVVCDYELPDLKGPALVTMILRHNPEIPVAILTSHAKEEVEDIVLRAGAQYFDKTRLLQDCDEFVRAVETLIEGRIYREGAMRRGSGPLRVPKREQSSEKILIPEGVRKYMTGRPA